MASLAEINIRFRADLKGFSTQMQSAQKQLDKTGRNLKRVGSNLSVGLTAPLLALGGLAVKTFSEIEGVSNAFNRLDSPDLLSNLRAATKGTVADLELMQSAVKAENFQIPLDQLSTLLEFARRRAKDTGESVDYLVDSIVTGIGRKSPLILDNLGISASALKDELGGVSAASSSVADVTKAVGKIARQELGKMGEDTLTLKESFLQISTSVKNTFAELGSIIADLIKPVIPVIQNIAKSFQELSPTTKKWIVIIGGVAAAVGPLLALAGTILPAILTGFTILTGPIGLIAAALTGIGIIIYKNWAPIKQTLLDIANYFVDLYNESIVFKIAVEAVVATFKTFWEIGKFVFEGLKSLLSGLVDGFTSGFKTIGEVFKAVMTGNFDALPGIIEDSGKRAMGNFADLTANLAKDWTNLVDGIQQVTNDGLANVTSRKKLEYFKNNVDASGITEAVSEATQKGILEGSKPTGKGVGKKTTIENEVELADIDSKIAELETIDDLLASTGDNFRKAIEKADVSIFLGTASDQYETFLNDTEDNLVQPFQEKMERLKLIGEAVGDSVGGAFEALSGRIVDSLGLASTGFEGFIKGLVQTVTKLISIMLAQSISQSIAGATASGAATGPASVFTTPGFIASAISGVLAAFASIPKFATGGIVGGTSFYGDQILARVNSGELILNQRQQQRLASSLDGGVGQMVTVDGQFRLVGSDLVASIDRTNLKESRRS